jgi:hypothetical protein
MNVAQDPLWGRAQVELVLKVSNPVENSRMKFSITSAHSCPPDLQVWMDACIYKILVEE